MKSIRALLFGTVNALNRRSRAKAPIYIAFQKKNPPLS